MIKIINPADCCGCTACASICPRNAISMLPDKLGFLYPKVDMDLCVECGLCEKVCAFNDHYDTSSNFDVPKAFAARHKDMHEIETSRSGAAFIALSDSILNKGGIVYGAGYTDHFRVVHKRCLTKDACKELKGSKYVQSDLGNIFRQIKEDLRKGELVLFSGTPCQTAGLHSYVGKRFRENLFLVDIVCHGVPSPYIWRDYLQYMERKYGTVFTEVNFRDKTKAGWASHLESFKADRLYVQSTSFTYLFYKHIMFRHSCEVCHYANLKRPSDVTIADFWGWQKTDPDFNKDNKGCSLIFSNTPKGLDWFRDVAHDLHSIPAKIEDCMQPNLKSPSFIDKQRMQFEKDYSSKGFEYVARRYGDLGWRYRVHMMLRKCKKTIKRLIGKK